MSYKHLTLEERYQIKAYKHAGFNNLQISKYVQVHPSTISRELKRNKGKLSDIYFPDNAQEYANSRKSNNSKLSNKKITEDISKLISKYIKKDWSPEQVSAILKKDHNVDISYVRIYWFVWNNRSKGGDLYTHLRQQGKKRVKYGCKYKGKIPDRVSISKRPKIVDSKSRIGDFEADTIIGKNQKGAIVTIIDRKSMFVKISSPITKEADPTAKYIIKLLSKYKSKVHTITTDNGFEFSAHKQVSKKLKCDYYFCHPYSSWERGLGENINGLIRQYIPKGSSFENITKSDIRKIENKLNHRPRKSLDWKTPYEIFNEIEKAS